MRTAIVWFRKDLRLNDNPALYYAAQENENLILLYILDEDTPSQIGSAQQWWLHHSLSALENTLKKRGATLTLKRGNPQKILLDICNKNTISSIYWNRCYEPTSIERDSKIKEALKTQGIEANSYNGYLLHEPFAIKNKQGGYFKVFTPFSKTCHQQVIDTQILPVPRFKQQHPLRGDLLNSWKLLPHDPNWAESFGKTWHPGEIHANKQLKDFISQKLCDYPISRDFPAKSGTSYLSPHLHFGEISPRQILNTIKLAEIHESLPTKACEHFLRELTWREFSYHLLYHFPTLPEENFRKEFDHFSWSNDKKSLNLWQKGQTGYPLIDAGMRELWHTGYMHNRVRMITASFLTKHLLIHWREGAKWFWDTLLDADLANNSMNWQWVAGSGVDAAPYFRIFNPITQSEKFDPEGKYIRQWVPELSSLPSTFIHKPWKAPTKILEEANIILDEDYPTPMIDHEFARKRALDHYQKCKNKI